MSRRRKGRLKRRERDLGSTLFPKCSPPSGTHRDSQSWVEKKRGREEMEVTGGEKRESKQGESNQASNHTPK